MTLQLLQKHNGKGIVVLDTIPRIYPLNFFFKMHTFGNVGIKVFRRELQKKIKKYSYLILV